MITGQALTVSVIASLSLQPFASVTVNVIGKVPVCVGVPDRSPPEENVIPGGRAPVSDQTIGTGGPLWVNVVAG